MARGSNVVRLHKSEAVYRYTQKEDRERKMARIVHGEMQREFGNTAYFTREDILQLTVMQNVATITRYHYVCDIVHRLLRARQLVTLSRTELCFAGQRMKREDQDTLHASYAKTVERHVEFVRTHGRKRLSVMDIVKLWTSDPQLTTNAKRVATRANLRRLVREGKLRRGDMLDYQF